MTGFNKRTLIMCSALLLLCGCGKAAEPTENAMPSNEQAEAAEPVAENTAENVSETEGMANPWEESDSEDIFASLGIFVTPPEGASDVSFEKNMDESIAQMLFKLDEPDPNMKYTYRVKKSEKFEDISGLYYDWDVDADCMVGACEGKTYRAFADGQTIDSVLWYDADEKLMYSVSTAAEDLDGFDLVAIAGMVYMPVEPEEGFIPSNFLEAELMSDSFESYEDIISKLNPGNAYAYVQVMGCDEQLLAIAEGAYDNGDGNMAAIDASFYLFKDGKVNNIGNVYSSGTAYPISLTKDGKVYSGGNHEVDVSCVCPETEGIMTLVYAYESFDESGNATYGGFVRTEPDLGNDGEEIAEDDSSVLEGLYEEYGKLSPINFTVVGE